MLWGLQGSPYVFCSSSGTSGLDAPTSNDFEDNTFGYNGKSLMLLKVYLQIANAVCCILLMQVLQKVLFPPRSSIARQRSTRRIPTKNYRSTVCFKPGAALEQK